MRLQDEASQPGVDASARATVLAKSDNLGSQERPLRAVSDSEKERSERAQREARRRIRALFDRVI